MRADTLIRWPATVAAWFGLREAVPVLTFALQMRMLCCLRGHARWDLGQQMGSRVVADLTFGSKKRLQMGNFLFAAKPSSSVLRVT
jgi:hypothetical protein